MQLISTSQGTTGYLISGVLTEKNKYNYLIKIFKIPPVKWFDRVWCAHSSVLTVKFKCLTSRMSGGASLQTKRSFKKNLYYNSNNKNNNYNNNKINHHVREWKRICSAYSFSVFASILLDYHIKYMVFVEVTKGGFTSKEHTRDLRDSTGLVTGYDETNIFCIYSRSPSKN